MHGFILHRILSRTPAGPSITSKLSGLRMCKLPSRVLRIVVGCMNSCIRPFRADNETKSTRNRSLSMCIGVWNMPVDPYPVESINYHQVARLQHLSFVGSGVIDPRLKPAEMTLLPVRWVPPWLTTTLLLLSCRCRGAQRYFTL